MKVVMQKKNLYAEKNQELASDVKAWIRGFKM